jgi:hypothetical protein
VPQVSGSPAPSRQLLVRPSVSSLDVGVDWGRYAGQDSPEELDMNPQTVSGMGVQEALLRSQPSPGNPSGAPVGMGEMPSTAINPIGVTRGSSHGTAITLPGKKTAIAASEAAIVDGPRVIVDVRRKGVRGGCCGKVSGSKVDLRTFLFFFFFLWFSPSQDLSIES